MGGSNFHFLIDVPRTYVQRTAEEAREGEDIVDLVRMIGSAGSDDGCTGFFCLIRFDFRDRIGHWEDNRPFRHRLNHFSGDNMRRTDTDEDIRTAERIREGSAEILRICPRSHFSLRRIHFNAFRENSEAVHHQKVLYAEVQDVFSDRYAGGSGAVDDAADFRQFLFHDAQRIEKRGPDDDCRSVLVVMENRNIADFL